MTKFRTVDKKPKENVQKMTIKKFSKKFKVFFEKDAVLSYNCISNTKTTKKVENQGGKYYEKT